MDDSGGTTEEFYFGATVEVLQRLRLPEIDAEWVAASWDSQGCDSIDILIFGWGLGMLPTSSYEILAYALTFCLHFFVSMSVRVGGFAFLLSSVCL